MHKARSRIPEAPTSYKNRWVADFLSARGLYTKYCCSFCLGAQSEGENGVGI